MNGTALISLAPAPGQPAAAPTDAAATEPAQAFAALLATLAGAAMAPPPTGETSPADTPPVEAAPQAAPDGDAAQQEDESPALIDAERQPSEEPSAQDATTGTLPPQLMLHVTPGPSGENDVAATTHPATSDAVKASTHTSAPAHVAPHLPIGDAPASSPTGAPHAATDAASTAAVATPKAETAPDGAAPVTRLAQAVAEANASSSTASADAASPAVATKQTTERQPPTSIARGGTEAGPSAAPAARPLQDARPVGPSRDTKGTTLATPRGLQVVGLHGTAEPAVAPLADTAGTVIRDVLAQAAGSQGQERAAGRPGDARGASPSGDSPSTSAPATGTAANSTPSPPAADTRAAAPSTPSPATATQAAPAQDNDPAAPPTAARDGQPVGTAPQQEGAASNSTTAPPATTDAPSRSDTTRSHTSSTEPATGGPAEARPDGREQAGQDADGRPDEQPAPPTLTAREAARPEPQAVASFDDTFVDELQPAAPAADEATTPADDPARTATRTTGAPTPTGERAAMPLRQAMPMAWLRTMMGDGARASLRQGWQTLELQLEEQGALTIHARREDERVAVAVQVTDPSLRHLVNTQASQLRSALEAQYGTDVDFSLMSDDGGASQQDHASGDRRGSHTPPGGPSEADEPAGPAASRRGAHNVWVG